MRAADLRLPPRAEVAAVTDTDRGACLIPLRRLPLTRFVEGAPLTQRDAEVGEAVAHAAPRRSVIRAAVAAGAGPT